MAWSPNLGLMFEPVLEAVGSISARFGGGFASTTALKALAANRRTDNMVCFVDSGRSLWQFDSGSSATDSTEHLVLTPSAGSGRWIRLDRSLVLQLSATYATADAGVLFTVPTGFTLSVGRGWWNNSIAWSGGSSSAIGASSSNTAYNTKGDLVGGATGDVAAGMGTGIKGTIGDKIASQGIVVLVAGNTIRFDRITSAYTAGAGVLNVPITVM